MHGLYDDDEFEVDPTIELDEDDEESGAEAVERPLPSLAQMGKDCDWAAEHIEKCLAEDPDYPTDKLLAEVRTRVRPIAGYRPTQGELNGLGILAMRAKISDRIRELENEEEKPEAKQKL